MQIVIDIPEEYYKAITEIPNHQCTADMLIIKNGTPLTKGHGTLKDVDNIKTAFPSGEYVRTESVRATIDHEETIIEADKESEDKG
jgi:hypothetical protein